MSYDAIILGAGAAGCMAAIQAGQRGRKVLLIDQGKRVGGKIPISGGGRCNFTNRGADASHYLCSNPHFLKSALARFSAADTEAWVAAAGIPYHEKTLGQLFCDRSAGDIVGLLERDLKDAGVEVWLHKTLEGVEKEDQFRVFGSGWEAHAPQLVIALGGKSYPTLGASDIGLRLATQFHLPLIENAPALDGFVFAQAELELFDGLAGLSTPVRLTAGGRRYEESLLVTHRGLSGPVALQGSLWWRPGQDVEIDWLPEDADDAGLIQTKRDAPKESLSGWLGRRLPRRLAERLADAVGPGAGPLERYSDQALRDTHLTLRRWRFKPAGTVGWHKAEVMRGGVDVEALDQKTMQAKSVPGLYCIGEVVDVTGELGGYNFQWAWASGAAAGRAL